MMLALKQQKHAAVHQNLQAEKKEEEGLPEANIILKIKEYSQTEVSN